MYEVNYNGRTSRRLWAIISIVVFILLYSIGRIVMVIASCKRQLSFLSSISCKQRVALHNGADKR